MFLRIIIAVFCFSSLYSFSMDCSGPSIQDVDHAWFLTKLVEYKRAHVQRQQHDKEVVRLQKKNAYSGDVNPLVRRVGIAPSSYGLIAKL